MICPRLPVFRIVFRVSRLDEHQVEHLAVDPDVTEQAAESVTWRLEGIELEIDVLAQEVFFREIGGGLVSRLVPLRCIDVEQPDGLHPAMIIDLDGVAVEYPQDEEQQDQCVEISPAH